MPDSQILTGETEDRHGKQERAVRRVPEDVGADHEGGDEAVDGAQLCEHECQFPVLKGFDIFFGVYTKLDDGCTDPGEGVFGPAQEPFFIVKRLAHPETVELRWAVGLLDKTEKGVFAQDPICPTRDFRPVSLDLLVFCPEKNLLPYRGGQGVLLKPDAKHIAHDIGVQHPFTFVDPLEKEAVGTC